jgi:hypothetical protein
MEVGRTGFHQAETFKLVLDVLPQRKITHHRAIKRESRPFGESASDVDSGIIVAIHHGPTTTLESCRHGMKLLVVGSGDIRGNDEEPKQMRGFLLAALLAITFLRVH